MPSIISSLKVLVPFSSPPPPRIVEKWARGAKNNAEFTNENPKLIVPDATAFQKKIGDTAAKGYSEMMDFMSPSYRSRKGKSAQKIINAQRANIMRAFENYDASLEYAFEEIDGEGQKRFKERIDNSKDLYANGLAERTLRFTGDHINTGLGVAPIAALWLVGDSKILGQLPPGSEVIYGGPVNIANPGLEPNLKSALVPRLVQSGIAVVQSEMDAVIIADENGLINKLISALRDNTVYEEFVEPLAPLKSHCGYVVENGQLYLRIQVVKL